MRDDAGLATQHRDTAVSTRRNFLTGDSHDRTPHRRSPMPWHHMASMPELREAGGEYGAQVLLVDDWRAKPDARYMQTVRTAKHNANGSHMKIKSIEFKNDMAEFKRHKKAVDYMDKANGNNETFATKMIDHLARSLDRVYETDRFMKEACK